MTDLEMRLDRAVREGDRMDAARAIASARPFVKMLGGKRKLLPELTARMPSTFGNYFEPFVGGGALFFHVNGTSATPRQYVVGDTSEHLVASFRAVRDNVRDLVRRLRGMPNDEDFFRRVRAIDVDAIPADAPGREAAIAARFIYLNKTCFNGLHRVNRKGQFNAPFGRYPKPAICDEANLIACSRSLEKTVIRCMHYGDTIADALAGDFVYCDPPYLPLSATSNFTEYNAGGFGFGQHAALAEQMRALKASGVHVMISNSDTPRIRELYADFDVREVMASRSVNSKGSGRGKITELIIT